LVLGDKVIKIFIWQLIIVGKTSREKREGNVIVFQSCEDSELKISNGMAFQEDIDPSRSICTCETHILHRLAKYSCIYGLPFCSRLLQAHPRKTSK